MRHLLVCVKNDAKEGGKGLQELQGEMLAHPDRHLVAEFYEVPYPVIQRTSVCTIPITNQSVTGRYITTIRAYTLLASLNIQKCTYFTH